MLFSKNGKSFISASNDGTVRFWDISKETITWKLILRKPNHILDIKISPDGKYYAAGSAGGEIIIVSTENINKQVILTEEGHKRVTSLYWINNRA